MKNCYRPWMESTATNAIFASLDNNARFVGGAVRDAILGKDATDIDINTPLSPEEVTTRLKVNGIKVIPTGIKHGTVTAIVNDSVFEITTLRRDVNCNGRHAEIEFTDSWEEDAARRDFTINAMSCSQKGEIFDYFGGISDLINGRIKFVGNAKTRCNEDYLRILRFFRFFAYYGQLPFDISAIDACRELCGGIDGLSGERIQTEMFKLIAAPNPVYSLQLMVQTNVIQHVIEDITISHIVYLENLISTQINRSADPVLRLAVMLCYNTQGAKMLSKLWKLSNLDKSRLFFLCNPENAIQINIDDASAKKIYRKYGKENFLDTALLAYSYGMDKGMYDKLTSLEKWHIPDFPLKGSDLIKIGIQPGKDLGNLLKFAEKCWEDNDYQPQKLELIELIKKQHNENDC